MTQRFKENDPTELDIIGLALPTLTELGLERDALFLGAFTCFLLGDVLYEEMRDPLANVITQEVYRESFPAIHDLFTRPGTFEFYLDVFHKIFPADTAIEFVIPGPGILEINIDATTFQTVYLMARRIEDDAYVYENLVTSDTNDKITGRVVKGIKTQDEVDGLIVEISAYGVFTTATLTF